MTDEENLVLNVKFALGRLPVPSRRSEMHEQWQAIAAKSIVKYLKLAGWTFTKSPPVEMATAYSAPEPREEG